MLRTALLVAAAALVACGGASPSPAPTPSPTPSGSTAVELWAAVMKPGAVFSFVDQIEQGAEQRGVVEARVAEVKEVEGGRAALLEWTHDGEPMVGEGIPSVIVVGEAGVTFYSDADNFAAPDPEAAMTFPATAAAAKLPGGLFIVEDDDSLCYGWGPEDDAPDCEDVCYAQLCVHPTRGLTGGEGRWWPDWSIYEARTN